MNAKDATNNDAPAQALPESVRPIEDLKLDPFELGLLAVGRQFLAGFEAPELPAWQRAYDIAIQRWGETIGFPAAHGLLKLLKCVLSRRADGFAFQDPLCLEARLFATEDEAALMGMIHFMRRDETSPARDCLEALFFGRREVDVIQAGLSFAARFPAGDRKMEVTQARPRLRVVN